MGIKESMDRPGKTRFAGWHYAATGMRRCLPAVEHIVKDEIIEVKKVSTSAAKSFTPANTILP